MKLIWELFIHPPRVICYVIWYRCFYSSFLSFPPSFLSTKNAPLKLTVSFLHPSGRSFSVATQKMKRHDYEGRRLFTATFPKHFENLNFATWRSWFFRSIPQRVYEETSPASFPARRPLLIVIQSFTRRSLGFLEGLSRRVAQTGCFSSVIFFLHNISDAFLDVFIFSRTQHKLSLLV